MQFYIYGLNKLFRLLLFIEREFFTASAFESFKIIGKVINDIKVSFRSASSSFYSFKLFTNSTFFVNLFISHLDFSSFIDKKIFPLWNDVDVKCQSIYNWLRHLKTNRVDADEHFSHFLRLQIRTKNCPQSYIKKWWIFLWKMFHMREMLP